MRWYIVRTLLRKEIWRHQAERGALFLALLLIVTTVLLSYFGKASSLGGRFTIGVKGCVVIADERDDWINFLLAEKVPDLYMPFRTPDRMPRGPEGEILLDQSAVAIEIHRVGSGAKGQPRYRVTFWYQGNDPASNGPCVAWFWTRTLEHFRSKPIEIVTAGALTFFPKGNGRIEVGDEEGGTPEQPLHRLRFTHADDRDSTPALELVEEFLPYAGTADLRSLITSTLIYFALVLFSVYLMPSLTCEERERGVLLAQALSPASPVEILAAKFLFYPAAGMTLAAVIAGIYQPAVLLRPLFWLVLLTTSVGFLGVGLTIATISRTQRGASMTAMCYLITVTLVVFISQTFGIAFLQVIFLESYGPRLLHALLADRALAPVNYFYLGMNTVLATLWVWLAVVLFRRQGWQ